MSDNERQVDESFGEFMDDIIGTPEEKKEPETQEVIEEEESHEEEVQDEAEQEDADDSEEETEEETAASEEGEDDEDEDEEPEEESEDPRDAIIAQMQARLDALEKPKAPPKEEKEEPPPLPDDLQQRILGDLDIDDVTSDPKLFMQVIQNALTVGRDMTYEHVMKAIPNMVIQQTKGYQDLMSMQRRFYKKNKDLRSFKNIVANAANEVHSEHPDWEVEKVLEEAAKVARKTIGITTKKSKLENPPSNKPKQKPAFAKTPSSKKPKAQQVSKLQKDINDTLDI